jgi:predicted nucleotidyltransferase
MAFTEVKERNEKKYYYRVASFRNKDKISKKRKYLGVDLSKEELLLKENRADKEFGILDKRKKTIEEIKSKILKILKKNNIKRAGIFGSYARGEQRKDSDVDILVELGKPMGFAFFGLNQELEEILKKKVDLITYHSLNPYLKDRILSQEIRII